VQTEGQDGRDNEKRRDISSNAKVRSKIPIKQVPTQTTQTPTNNANSNIAKKDRERPKTPMMKPTKLTVPNGLHTHSKPSLHSNMSIKPRKMGPNLGTNPTSPINSSGNNNNANANANGKDLRDVKEYATTPTSIISNLRKGSKIPRSVSPMGQGENRTAIKKINHFDIGGTSTNSIYTSGPHKVGFNLKGPLLSSKVKTVQKLTESKEKETNSKLSAKERLLKIKNQ